MHKLISILAIVVLFITAGCSRASKMPTQPDYTNIPQINLTDQNTEILYTGYFEIDVESQTIKQMDSRQLEYVYDITAFLPDKCPGGCFRFAIVNIVGTVLEIELTMENPLTLQIYDVRVVYLDLFGKIVLNPNSYTDFLGTPVTEILPFTAFTSETSDRAFPVGPGGIDTETLFLDFPPGSIAAVNYAITASLPGQTLEPYEINNMQQSGNLSPGGGSATISCSVFDHQADVSAVYLDATPFTGAPVPMIQDPLVIENYDVIISNSAGAPVGSYNQLIMALSSNGQNISTYNYVTIVVQETGDLVACFTADPEEARMEIDPTIYFDGSCSHDDSGYDITQYEWDFNWDGVPANFSVDDNTTTPLTSHTYSAPGTYTIGLRVTNNAVPPQTSSIFSDDVIIHGWILPPIKLTGEDVGYTDMWWCVDPRVATTSDGLAHIVAENYYPDVDPPSDRTKIEYYTCDSNGVLSSEVLFTGGISDIGIQITNSDEIYVFYMKSTGDIVYRLNSGGGFDSEVFAFTRNPSWFLDHAAYAVNMDGHIIAMMSEFGEYPDTAHISYSINTGSGFSPKTEFASPDRWTNNSGNGVGITLGAIADHDGVFHLAWDGLPAINQSNRDVWYSYYDGSMSPADDIATTSTQEYFPLLRVDGDNNLWCGYRTYTENWMAVKWAGNNTFDPGFISAMYPAYNYSFDINPDSGQIMHVASHKISSQYDLWFKIYDTSDSPTEIMNTTEYRVDDSSDARQWWPNVAFSPEGHWYAVWDDQRELADPTALGELFFAMYY